MPKHCVVVKGTKTMLQGISSYPQKLSQWITVKFIYHVKFTKITMGVILGSATPLHSTVSTSPFCIGSASHLHSTVSNSSIATGNTATISPRLRLRSEPFLPPSNSSTATPLLSLSGASLEGQKSLLQWWVWDGNRWICNFILAICILFDIYN